MVFLFFLPQPAWAADNALSSSDFAALGAVALAFAACLWALSTRKRFAELRRSVGAIRATARTAIAACEAIIESGRESVVVWGPDATRSYGRSEALLGASLAGPDALLLSQALDDLSETGAPFALDLHVEGGDRVRARGRAVGAMAAVWLETQSALPSSGVAANLPSILDALPLPVWLRDQTLSLTWANRAYLEAVGAADLGSVIKTQIALENSERGLAGEALAESAPIEAKRYAVIQGQRRALTFTEAPLGNGQVLGTAADVTDVAKAESLLQQHLDAHGDILDKLATAVAIFDRDQRLSFHNHAFAQLWNLPEQWLNARPSDGEVLDRLREMRQLPEQRDYREWKRERLAAYDHPDSFLPEELWHLPNGKTLRVVAQPHPFGGLTCLYEDITEKLALESSYNTLIGVQRATLDSLGEAVAVFGLDGRLKLHNAAFARLWRLEPATISNCPHIKEIAQACVQTFGEGAGWQELVSAVLSSPERALEWGQIERPDRTIVTVGLAPLPDGATLVTFADVSDRHRVETALRERNQALMAADELKSTFVQHASFLFRDPLNVVQGFADMLAGGHAGALSAKQADYVQSIAAGSRKLAEITSDMLDLALIESGNMQLELTTVELYDLLTRAADPLRQHVSARDISFTLDATSDLGLVVLDQRRIRQIVFNLLSNALKYTPRGGSIALGGRIVGEDVQIYVSDSGPGIATEVQPKVFERFAAKARGGHRPGAGLGLALVNSFVALHDGWVEIETEEGRGTLVRCHLPLRMEQDVTTATEGVHAA